MSAMFEWLGANGSEWPVFVAGVAIKAALILLAALIATRALRRSSASIRHRVWTLAFVAVLSLPLLAGALPSWTVTVPVWTVAGDGASSNGPVLAPTVPTESAGAVTRDLASAPSGDDLAGPAVVGEAGAIGADGAVGVPASRSPARALLFVWAAGAVLLLGRLAVGVTSAWWTSRTGTPVMDVGWTRRVREVADELGIRGPVRVLRSPWVGTPMAWGILRPTLLLPLDAGTWPAERRRAVVLHEMAHIKRRDCLVHLLAQAVRAVHWPNPLAWIGTRRLRTERERACDDLVLTSGTRSADYAKLLLDVARARGDRRLAWATVSMARPSELEGRLLAILDPARDRSGIGRPLSFGGLLAFGVVAAPLAAFQAAPAVEPPLAEPGARPPVALPAAAQGAVAETPRRPEVEIARQAASPSGETGAPDAGPPAVDEPKSRMTSRDRSRTMALHGDAGVAADTLDRRILDAMERALGSESPGIRARAARTLGQSESSDAVPLLLDVVRSDESGEVRREAAWALGMIEDAAGVPALAAAVEDEDAGVRSEAAWALGMIESSEGVPGLLTALDDESAGVRSQAAWGLGMIESADAVDRLIRALSSDESASVRSQAAWALGMIEDGRAMDALIDAIEDPDESVAEQAIWALGQVMG